MRKLLLLCAILSIWHSSQAVTVSIDKSTTYQTIDGFGTFAAISPWKVKEGPFYVTVDLSTNGFFDDVINQMGLTIMRVGVPYEITPSAGVYQVPSNMRQTFTYLQQLKAIADQNGEPFRVIASVWSPPAWMKINKQIEMGGNNFLDPVHFTDFANHLVKFLEFARDTFGIDIYAISPQNEPAFDEPYASCNYYNGTNYANMLEVVGPIVKGAGFGTMIFGCEHMAWAFPGWENEIKANATAAASMDRYAFHGYSDGIQADPESFDNISATEKPIWMSETCNYGDEFEWAGAFTLAETILKFVERGNLSAWVWWQLMGANSDTYGTQWIVQSTDGQRSPRYYTSAQIYRFLRPGMKKVRTTCSDGALVIGSCKDDSKNSMSVVIVNTASSQKSITLNISGGTVPAEFEALQTTNGSYLVNVGPVAGNATFTVPGKSITSLGYNVRGETSVASRGGLPSSVPVVKALREGCTAQTFDLTGRKVDHALGQDAARGAYFRTFTGSDGRTIVAERVMRVR